MIRAIALVAVLLAAGASAALAQDKPQAPFPVIEDYLNDGGIGEYGKQVGKFLKENPGSPYAARVHLDLMMLYTLRNDADEIRNAKSLLLVKYLNTVPGQYVLTTFKDGEEFGKFIVQIAKEHGDPLETVSSTMMAKLARAGLKRFGPSALEDTSANLLFAAAAESAGDLELRNLAVQRLQKRTNMDEEFHRTVNACFVEAHTPFDRVVALHDIHGDDTTRLIESFFIGQLPDNQRANPRIRRITAEVYLQGSKFAQALPLLDKLIEESGDKVDPPLRFWRGWCLATQGQYAPAMAELDRLVTAKPDDPWARSAKELFEQIDKLDANIDAHAAAEAAVVDRLKREHGQVEATVIYQPPDGEPIEIYLAMGAEQSIEAQVRSGGKMLLGYRSDAAASALYLGSENATHTYAEGGAAPVPQFSLTRDKDGGFSFAFNMGLGKSEGVSDSLVKFLASPWLTADGIKEGLKSMTQRRGKFPGPAQTTDAGRTYTMLTPQVDDAAMDRFTYTVSKDDKIVAFAAGRFGCKDLRYGSAGSFALSPPPWPQGRTVQHDKFDGAVFFKAMAELTALMTKTDAAPAPR